MIKERIDKLINTRNVEEVQWDSQVIVVSWWDSEMSLKERTISATCSEYGFELLLTDIQEDAEYF